MPLCHISFYNTLLVVAPDIQMLHQQTLIWYFFNGHRLLVDPFSLHSLLFLVFQGWPEGYGKTTKGVPSSPLSFL